MSSIGKANDAPGAQNGGVETTTGLVVTSKEANVIARGSHTINILHVQRSKKVFYQLRIMFSSIKFENMERMNVVKKALQEGVEAMAIKRPRKILV